MDSEWRMTPRQKLVHRLFLFPSCFGFFVFVFFNRMKKNKCVLHCERPIRNGTDSVLKGYGWTVETEPKSIQDGNTISCGEVLQLEVCRHISFWTAAGLLAPQFYLFSFLKLSTHLLLVINSQIRSGHLRLLCSVWMRIIYNTSDHSYLKCLNSSQLLFTGEQISH